MVIIVLYVCRLFVSSVSSGLALCLLKLPVLPGFFPAVHFQGPMAHLRMGVEHNA